MENPRLQTDLPTTYINSLFTNEDRHFLEARAKAQEWGVSHMSLSPNEARIVASLVQTSKCHKFLEIGTLSGLSALYIMDALGKSGMLWTLELDPVRADFSRGLLNNYSKITNCQVEVCCGDALAVLASFDSGFLLDGIFIDGNKSAYPEYLEWAENHIKTGGIIIADNVFLRGGVWGEKDTGFGEQQVKGLRKFNELISNTKKYKTSFIPTKEGLSFSIKI